MQQLQQLMQCLPTTILLSLSHCCLLSLIVPHFFSTLSLGASNRRCFFFCFFVCFTSSVCRSFRASVLSCFHLRQLLLIFVLCVCAFFFGFSFVCCRSLCRERSCAVVCFLIGEEFAARGMTRSDKGRKFELFVVMTGTEAQ